MPDFLLPDLGEGLTEAEIVAWHVQVGDEVEIDQVVVEVETAKAAVEVPVPFAGVVAALHAAPGQSIAVGAPLVSVRSGEPAAGSAESVVLDAIAEEDSGNVLIGYGTTAPPARRKRPRSAAQTPAEATTGNAVAVSSPLVRKIARDAHLDLSLIAGTGPGGLVLRRDVLDAVARVESGERDTPDGRRIPLTGLRKAVADKVSRSRTEIPEATVWVDVDATELLATRKALNEHEPQRPVGLLALVARFAIVGLRKYPELNGRMEADEIVLPSAVHLGIAAQTDRGLLVPVVRNAHRLPTRELSTTMATVATAARAGSLSPAELTGGSFTINNYGMFGVDGSAAIINHPEVAILGIGRIIDKPWVHQSQLSIRAMCQLTLTFDHRVCDGGTAGGFLRFVADCIQAPSIALGEL